MHNLHRITCFFVIFMMTSLAWAGIPTKPAVQRLVNDYAELLTADQVNTIEQQLVDFDNATSIQIAVVIVPSTEGEDAAEYAAKIGESWGVGQKGIDNGVVFLIAKNDRKMFIATGRGVDSYLPDATCSHICKEVVPPQFRSGNYFAGVQAGVQHIMNSFGKMSWEDRQAQQRILERQEELQREEFQGNVLLAVAILLGAAILLVSFVRYHTRERLILSVKEKVATLHQLYSEYMADKTPLDNAWPAWATNLWRAEEQHHWRHEADLKKLLETLPRDRQGFLKIDIQEVSDRIEKILAKVGTVNGRMKKVAEDVTLYKTRAPGALKELRSQHDKLNKLVLRSSEIGFHTERWSRKLKEVDTEIRKIGLESKEDYRNVYLRAYDFKQALDSIEESIDLEYKAFDSYREIGTGLKEWLDKTNSTKATYAEEAAALLKRYSGKTISKVFSGEKLEEMMAGVLLLIGVAEEIAKGNEDRKYRLAVEKLEEAGKISKKLDGSLFKVNQLVKHVDHDIKEFPNQYRSGVQTVNRALKAIKDSDVSVETQEMARTAMRDLKRAKAAMELDKPDVVKAYEEFEKAYKGATDAIAKAKEEIAKAEAKRARKAADKKQEEESEQEKHESYSAIPSSIISNLSSHSDSSSFGGFGGGSFGGGGGGGDW